MEVSIYLIKSMLKKGKKRLFFSMWPLASHLGSFEGVLKGSYECLFCGETITGEKIQRS